MKDSDKSVAYFIGTFVGVVLVTCIGICASAGLIALTLWFLRLIFGG